MPKPRLGLVTSVIDNRKGKGTALVARRLLEHLRRIKDEFDITLIHHEKTDDPLYKEWPELVMPATSFPFGKKIIQETRFWLSLRRQKISFDIVHYLTPRVWPSYLFTPARKIIITAHEAGIMLDLHPHGLGDRLFQFTNRFLHQRMDKLIAVSEFGKQEIMNYFHVDKNKVAVIPNAVDASFAKADDANLLDDLKKKYEIEAPYILSVGRLDPHKNILRLLEAYALARQSGLPYRLVLVGGKHLPDYSRQVEVKIKSLNLGPYVLIAPYIEDSDLPKLYTGARALIYPSLHEGFGLPILEAMACDAPVAVSNTSSLPEIAGGGALLFNPLDNKDIADAIIKITSDEPLRERLIQKGRQRIKDFSWDKSAEKLFNLYRNILKD